MSCYTSPCNVTSLFSGILCKAEENPNYSEIHRFVHRIGQSLSCNLLQMWTELGVLADPTYMIRAIPSNASDNVYCTLLAQSAVHGAMAGFTGFTSGLVNGRHTYIPFNVSIHSDFWDLKLFDIHFEISSQSVINIAKTDCFWHDKNLSCSVLLNSKTRFV